MLSLVWLFLSQVAILLGMVIVGWMAAGIVLVLGFYLESFSYEVVTEQPGVKEQWETLRNVLFTIFSLWTVMVVPHSVLEVVGQWCELWIIVGCGLHRLRVKLVNH